MSLMRPLASMRSDFDRLFSDLEREVFAPMVTGRRSGEGMESVLNVWSPPVNIVEKEREVMVTASVPGLRPEDLNVEVEGNVLSVSGETRQETEDKESNYYRREIVQGRFYRQVQLPVEVEVDKANARFENGMLMVSIPKSQQTRRHKIKIGK
jgi:HSP20 family protein